MFDNDFADLFEVRGEKRPRRGIGSSKLLGPTDVELETIARQYYLTLAIGGPVLLSQADIGETAAAFGSYGVQDPPSKSAKKTAKA